MIRKLALFAFAATLTACGPASRSPMSGEIGDSLAATGNCRHPWVFCDLGAGTLVDTSKYDFDRDTGPISPVPGALDYLAALARAGYTLGLIVNVPADWGASDDAKIFKVIDMIDRAWTILVPLDWGLFGKIGGTGEKRHFAGRFLVPDTDAHRKPDRFLFLKALEQAGGCKALYMTNLRDEGPSAAAAGMAAYVIEGRGFLPVDQIDEYVARHTERPRLSGYH